MKRIFVSQFVLATVLGATSAYGNPAGRGVAMELNPKSVVDVSDANVCGDFNVVKVFDLTLDDADLDPNGNFIVTPENLAKIQAEAKSLISFNNGLFVAHRGEEAISNLTRTLGLTRDRRGDLVLRSCHDLSVIDSFKLKVDRDQLVPINDQVGANYFTLGVEDPSIQDAQFLKYHMFVDVEARQLSLFTIL